MAKGDIMTQLVKCSVCGGSVSMDADSCPHCGHPRLARLKSDVRWAYARMIFVCAATGIIGLWILRLIYRMVAG